MSHLKERTEKICLNCGAVVKGRFCHECGQENVELRETFWQLILHFVEDLTHFDGKIWLTLKYLLTKPAFLTRAYLSGQRVRFIHPIRMYIFISAVFFLYIFSGNQNDISLNRSKGNPGADTVLTTFSNELKDEMKNKQKDTANIELSWGEGTKKFKTVTAYDSSQQVLPVSKRDSWLDRKVTQQIIHVNEKYNGESQAILYAILKQFRDYFSRMLYISLPLFAFFLWVLYRRNKYHYFVEHLIFSIHLYCAFYIILFLAILLNQIGHFFIETKWEDLNAVAAIALLFYLYKSLLNHFQQSKIKTFVKFIVLNLFTFVLMGVLMIVFITLSVFNI